MYVFVKLERYVNYDERMTLSILAVEDQGHNGYGNILVNTVD